MSTYLLLVFLFLFLYSKFYGRCHLTVDVPFFYILLFGAFHSLSLIVQPVINRITVLVIDFRIGTDKSQLFRWQHTLLRQRNRYRNCSPDKSMPDSNFVPSAVWHSAVTRKYAAHPFPPSASSIILRIFAASSAVSARSFVNAARNAGNDPSKVSSTNCLLCIA